MTYRSSARRGNSSRDLPSSPLKGRDINGRNGRMAAVRESFQGGEIIESKRNRGGKKNYMVESDSDETEDLELANDGDDDDDDVEDGDEDDGEDDEDEDVVGEDDDEMDVDAEGEEDDDAEGETGVDIIPQSSPLIRVSRAKQTTRSRASTHSSRRVVHDDDDISETDGPSKFAGGTVDNDDEEDVVEDEIEVIRPSNVDSDDEDAEADSDDEVIPGGDETPDLSKMTRRQRALYVDEPQQYMKLSDEVQVKKHFTAEELSMKRAEMARRRRNLSEKRNEEVKMETINKLLKKQAPKTTKRTAQATEEAQDANPPKPNPTFTRWVNNNDGSFLSIPEEMLVGPLGAPLQAPVKRSGKIVEEIS